MPNIKTYDQPQLGIRPTEAGVEATAAAARRGNAFFTQAAGDVAATGHMLGSALTAAGEVAVKYETHRQISNGIPQAAGMLEGYTAKWKTEINDADSHDPSVAPRFREAVDKNLNEWTSGFTTEGAQAWAQSTAERIRHHMFVTTAADMSQKAKDDAAVSIAQTTNRHSNTLYRDPSPSTLATIFDGAKTDLEALTTTSPNISPEDASTVNTKGLQHQREQYVRATIEGAIRNGGDWRAVADDPKYAPYINRSEIEQFEKAEQYYKRVDRTEKRAQQQDLDYEARTKFHGDMNKLEMSLFNENGDLVASRQHIAQFRKIVEDNPRGASLEASRVKSVFSGLEQMVEKRERMGAAKDDTATVDDLTNRLFDPDNPTTMIQLGLAVKDEKVSKRTKDNLGFLIKEQNAWLHDPIWQSTKEGVKGLLGTDEVGKAKFASFMQDFLRKYSAARRDEVQHPGALPINALDLNDETSMIRQAMKPYKRNMQEMMRDRIMHGEFGPVPSVVPPPSTPGASIPTPLRGIAALDWKGEGDNRQYRDQMTGQIYDKDGKEIKAKPSVPVR